MCINEVPKFLAGSPSETSHSIQQIDPHNVVHLLRILLHLYSVTSYFDAFLPSIVEYKNKEIPTIHLTAEETF